MGRPAKIHLDNTKSSGNFLTPVKPSKETNGALSEAESVASLVTHKNESKASSDTFSTANTALGGKSEPTHQTHGAVFPQNGPITSVAQLLGRPAVKGSIGAFESVEEYRAHLNNLTLGELHRHAVEEAKIVPIDDRGRLIRRLEGEYTAIAARNPRSKTAKPIIQPKPYTAEQLATLDALKRKMLKQ